MAYTCKDQIASELQDIKDAGLYKEERLITTAQGADIATTIGQSLNFCANNYLGLADHPEVVSSAQKAMDTHGFGMASVRFICGTQDRHKELESRLSSFLGMDDTILYSSCFDANGGVFEVLFGRDDAIISDELNHASIIDGVRLSKAARFRYANCDMDDLRGKLELAKESGARRIVVVTDGVFSMDGIHAPLPDICDLAEEFGAMVFVDDSHAVGCVGPSGKGTPEKFGVMDRVDIVTGTLGKALGGASGGYVSAHQGIVDLLRQRSRPYLFSNAVAPAVVAGSITALDIVEKSGDALRTLGENTALFRTKMEEAGFTLAGDGHAIVPVMFPGDDGARQATAIANHMLEVSGIYVIAFSFPVVPRGQARIRVQLSAAHSSADVEACVAGFVAARDALA